MDPHIEIAETNLLEVANLLNSLLADEFVINTKTRHAHWNIQGPNFMELHKFFQSQYEELDKIVDEVAERIRKIGHFPIGSLKDFLSYTNLKEDGKATGDETKLISDLVKDHETIIKIIRNDLNPISEIYNDAGTTDFVTKIMEQHEKMAWMLRSYLS